MHKMNRSMLLLLAATLLHVAASAQLTFAGKWVGALNNVNSFRMVFVVSEDKDGWKATMDVPAQGVKDKPAAVVTIMGDSIYMSWPELNGVYEGKFSDANNIKGFWAQNGMALTLNMVRTEGKVELNRPQTPTPPFSYNSEEIIFYNQNKSKYYGATITAPKDDGKHPALILISGSGPQNRDEELFGHKPFAVVADYLTKKGYIVLRIDDRGVGKSGGDRTHATSADYAEDVKDAIAFLKTRKEVDKKKIGLYGHSEGAMIAQMVAAENKELDFIILMAGPGVKLTEGMTEQSKAVLKSAGMNDSTANAYGVLYNRIVNDVISSSKKEEAAKKMLTSVRQWRTGTDSAIVLQTTGIMDEKTEETFILTFLDAVWNKWMVYFLNYDPEPVLAKVQCKVLALNGDKDIQVVSDVNLEGVKKALSKSKSRDYETRVIKGVNHLFQECDVCTVAEYGMLEQTIKPEVLQVVGDWLDNHVK